MKTVLILPGSQWQATLMLKAKEMGLSVIVVSPEADPVCAKIADDFFQSDIFDIKAILGYCRDKQISGILSDECDIAIPVVAELGEQLGVHVIGRKTAELYTDKFQQREFCREHGLKYPEYKLCRSLSDAKDFYDCIGGPIIIKPLDSNASHGVFTINSSDDLAAHFNEALQYSRIEKAVLAERYISGTEFTIDGIKTASAHYTLAVSEKKHFAHNKNIAYELFFTHHSSRFDYDALREINDKFIMESGLEYGFTHAEYKYEDGAYYLIEIAARGGGNQISALITQFMSGYDTYRYLVECALGGTASADFSIRPEYKDKAAVLRFFHTPNGGGRVKRICGTGYLENEPSVLEFSLNFGVGDTIQDALNDSVRIGYYIAGKDTERELHELMREIDSKFRIELEE